MIEPIAEKPPRDENGWLLCSYCGMPTVLLESSAEIYGRDYGPVYRCPIGCGWVGTHKNSSKFKALGRIANRELRQAKQAAHAAFDPLWRAKIHRERCKPGKARAAGYRWLAEQLGIDPSVCHIGMMNVEGCRRVVEVCRPYYRKGLNQ